jgi:hypothetical protein
MPNASILKPERWRAGSGTMWRVDLPVVCTDARHVHAALSVRMNKSNA